MIAHAFDSASRIVDRMPFLAFFMLTAALAANAQDLVLKYPPLSKSGLIQLKEIAHEITESCAAPKCLVVFIGRSSVLISAYEEAYDLGSSVSLPATGLRSTPGARIDPSTRPFVDIVSDSILKPVMDQNSPEEIQVIDFVNSGETLVTAAILLDHFVAKNKLKCSVKAVSYGAPLNTLQQEELRSHGIGSDHLSLKSSKSITGDLLEVIQQKTKTINYAPYEEWRLTQKSPPLFQPDLRRPYKYIDETKPSPSHYASYRDVVQWLAGFKLESDEPDFSNLKSPTPCSDSVWYR